MSNKRICIVSAQYLPHTGGVENYVANLSRELAGRGHEVTILTSGADREIRTEINENGVEIIRLPSYQLMNGRFPFLKTNGRLRAFMKEFRKRTFDLMFVNVRFYTLSLYAVRLAKRMGVRCVLLDHGSSHVNTGGKLTTKLGELYEHMITMLEKRYCKEFACVSRQGTQWVKHFGIQTDVVLPNAVTVSAFEKMINDRRRDFRAEYGIPKEHTVIAFVGRLTLEKGIGELVEAVKRIGRDDVWLLAAGEGYLLDEMQATCTEQTRFVGRIPLPEVVSLLCDSNIFCLPSVSEGFPTSVLEAVMCGTYVITTYCGDAKEIVRDADHGVILPDNGVDGLTEAIRNALDAGDEARRAAAERCLQIVLENYTWNKTADKLLALIEAKDAQA